MWLFTHLPWRVPSLALRSQHAKIPNILGRWLRQQHKANAAGAQAHRAFLETRMHEHSRRGLATRLGENFSNLEAGGYIYLEDFVSTEVLG